MCSLICCWNACYCIHQHTYSSGLFIHFGWCSSADEEMVRSLLNSNFLFFTSKHSLSVPQSALISSVLPAPGSGPMHLRRAGLTSVASVEECDECCLYPSDSTILAWFKPRRSAPPWCLRLRLMFILRCLVLQTFKTSNTFAVWPLHSSLNNSKRKKKKKKRKKLVHMHLA